MSYFSISNQIINALQDPKAKVITYFSGIKLVLAIEYDDKEDHITIMVNKLIYRLGYKIQSMGKAPNHCMVNKYQDTILYPMIKKLFKQGYLNYVRNHIRHS